MIDKLKPGPEVYDKLGSGPKVIAESVSQQGDFPTTSGS